MYIILYSKMTIASLLIN